MDTFFELSGLNYQWETIFLQIVVQLELQKYLGEPCSINIKEGRSHHRNVVWIFAARATSNDLVALVLQTRMSRNPSQFPNIPHP